ncbi:hypothetical protein [Rhodoplanes sp. Z2-YC6860]|uniref:hypothetical protein n=1 Tax=Rhodoplanes sp. Z2-YC6860 TaxID=674703 RepID=UPI0012ED79EF|nr:hypothetical protein [Rhodoplanes sp. Z2-YC6860]
MSDRDDSNRRKPFDHADMKLIRANLHKLSAYDQLLVRVLATGGMRRGEAFAIASEQTKAVAASPSSAERPINRCAVCRSLRTL